MHEMIPITVYPIDRIKQINGNTVESLRASLFCCIFVSVSKTKECKPRALSVLSFK